MEKLIFSKTLPGIRVSIMSINDVYPPYQRGQRRHYKKGYWRLQIDVHGGHAPLLPGRTCYDLVSVHKSWNKDMADGLTVRQLILPNFPLVRILKYQKLKSLKQRPFLILRLQNLQTGLGTDWTISFPLKLVTA